MTIPPILSFLAVAGGIPFLVGLIARTWMRTLLLVLITWAGLAWLSIPDLQDKGPLYDSGLAFLGVVFLAVVILVGALAGRTGHALWMKLRRRR